MSGTTATITVPVEASIHEDRGLSRLPATIQQQPPRITRPFATRNSRNGRGCEKSAAKNPRAAAVLGKPPLNFREWRRLREIRRYISANRREIRKTAAVLA